MLRQLFQFLRSLFLFASGAKTHRLHDLEDDRHALIPLGALVCTISLMAAISGGHALSYLFQSRTVCLLLGAMWGCLFLQIERMLLESIREAAGDARTEEGRNSIKRLKRTRIAISLFSSLVIATPLLLLMFEEPIMQAKQQRHAAQNQEKIAKGKENIGRLETWIKSKEDERAALWQQYREGLKKEEKELDEGGLNRKRGKGPVAEALKENNVRIKTRLDQTETQFKEEIAKHKDEIKTEQEAILKLEAAKKDLVENLFELISICQDRPKYLLILFAIMGLLMSVDLMPVLIELQRKLGHYSLMLAYENGRTQTAHSKLLEAFGQIEKMPIKSSSPFLQDLQEQLKGLIEAMNSRLGLVSGPAQLVLPKVPSTLPIEPVPDLPIPEPTPIPEPSAPVEELKPETPGNSPRSKIATLAQKLRKAAERRKLDVAGPFTIKFAPGQDLKPVEVHLTLYHQKQGIGLIIWDRKKTAAADKEMARIRKRMSERGQRVEFIPSREIEADADAIVDGFIKRIEKGRRHKPPKAGPRPQLMEASNLVEINQPSIRRKDRRHA